MPAFAFGNISAENIIKIGTVISPGLRVTPQGKHLFDIEGKFGPGKFRIVQINSDRRDFISQIGQAFERSGPGLMVNINYEGGKFSYLLGRSLTHFPGNAALGFADSTELAFSTGVASGRELLEIGVNWNFAPVAEVLKFRQSRGIGTRAFSEDPDVVARLASSYIRGLQEAGVAATAKHFPYLLSPLSDYHESYPFVTMEITDRDIEGFRAAVSANVASIMVAHGVFTSIDPYSLSTFSERMIKGRIRDGLGYNGVVITDSLTMHCLNGIRKEIGLGEMCVRAFQAGFDMLLAEPDVSKGASTPEKAQRVQEASWETQAEILNAMVHAFLSGRITQERLDESAARVALLCGRYGMKRAPEADNEAQSKTYSLAIAAMTAERSLAIKDPEKILPLRPDEGGRIALIIPEAVKTTRADTSPGSEADLAAEISRYHGRVDVFKPKTPESIDLERLAGAKYAVIRSYYGYVADKSFFPYRELIKIIRDLNIPIILISAGSSIDLEELDADAGIACHSVSAASYAAAAKALFGSAKAKSFRPGPLTSRAENVDIIIPSTGQATLFPTLRLALKEAGLLKMNGFTPRVILALNGYSKENAEMIMRKWDQEIYGNAELNFLEGIRGKLSAMSAIAKELPENDILIFTDDDVAFRKGSFLAFANGISGERLPQLLTATPLPLLSEPGSISLYGGFWQNVFAAKRRYDLGVFPHPVLPGGSLTAVSAKYFPHFPAGSFPTNVNDTYFLMNSFFPNIRFCEGASYYQGFSTSPVEEFFRRVRVTRGARAVSEMFPFPFSGQLAALAGSEKMDRSTYQDLTAGQKLYLLANLAFSKAFKRLYPFFEDAKWHMALSSRRDITDDLWEKLYISRYDTPTIPPSVRSLVSDIPEEKMFGLFPEE
jgi:beta-N-acetylhexosaminidase